MKKHGIFILLAIILSVSCEKDDVPCPDCNVTYDCSNVDDISQLLQDVTEGKSLGIIFTYLGDTKWNEHFDPEHVISDGFFIIDSVYFYNLEYLLSFKLFRFIEAPPVYHLDMYFSQH